MSETPKGFVALVGRPNVGKSSLFNRLTGRRSAIVDDQPGVTRDRHERPMEYLGRHFTLVDTGGFDTAEDLMPALIRRQVAAAIDEADVIILLLDGRAGLTPGDEEMADMLRRRPQPVVVAVNKLDRPVDESNAAEFHALGLGEPIAVSAAHGLGLDDLLEKVVALLPADLPDESVSEEAVRVAVVGRPNAGKSSLVNKILGEERMIVSDVPGTTRDAIDTHIVYNDLPVTLIDTAGIRRRGKIEPGVEKFSVIRSLRAIDRCEVALLVIDATTGITAQDTHIAGYILEAWKSIVVVVNKWDAVEKDTYTMSMFTEHVRKELNFLAYVPVLFISAKTGQRVDQVMPMALKVQEERLARMSTSQINRIMQNAQDKHAPSNATGRSLRIYYGTQVRSDPPTFLLYCNDPELAHFSYIRYLENSIREEYAFTGTPIRLVFKARR